MRTSPSEGAFQSEGRSSVAEGNTEISELFNKTATTLTPPPSPPTRGPLHITQY
jgi:hypothetical protein